MLIPDFTDLELPYTKDGELRGDAHIDQFFRPYENYMYGNTEHLKKFKEFTNPVGIYQYYKNSNGCTLATWSVDLDFPPTFYILKDNDSETRGFLLYTMDNQVMFRAIEEHTEFATTVRINDKSFVFPPSDKWYTRTTLKAESTIGRCGEKKNEDYSVDFKVDKVIGGEFAPIRLDEEPYITLYISERIRELVVAEHSIYSQGLLNPRHWTNVERRYRNVSIPIVTRYVGSSGYIPTEYIAERGMWRRRFVDNYYSTSGKLVCRTSSVFEEAHPWGVVENVQEVANKAISVLRGTKDKTRLDSNDSYVQLGLRKMFTPGIIVIDGDNRTTVSQDTFTRYTDSGSFTNTPKPKQLFLFDQKMKPIEVAMVNGTKETVDFSPVENLVTTGE